MKPTTKLLTIIMLFLFVLFVLFLNKNKTNKNVNIYNINTDCAHDFSSTWISNHNFVFSSSDRSLPNNFYKLDTYTSTITNINIKSLKNEEIDTYTKNISRLLDKSNEQINITPNKSNNVIKLNNTSFNLPNGANLSMFAYAKSSDKVTWLLKIPTSSFLYSIKQYIFKNFNTTYNLEVWCCNNNGSKMHKVFCIGEIPNNYQLYDTDIQINEEGLISVIYNKKLYVIEDTYNRSPN